MKFGIFKIWFIIAAVSLIDVSAGPITRRNRLFRWRRFRLPKTHFRFSDHIRPIKYDLNLMTHLEDGSSDFRGVVRIKMLCINSTDTILLRTGKFYIDLKSVKLTDNHGKRVRATPLLKPATEEMFVLTTRHLFTNIEYDLTIAFAGNYAKDPVGYYRSSYVDEATNQTRWYAATCFERRYARRALPCFDYPEMLAKFKIRIGHQKHLTAVSNMPLKKTSPLSSNPNYVVDEFEESPTMSPNFVAYMVSDFAYVECDSRDGGTKFRILARKDVIGQTELAKQVVSAVSRYYEDYFDENFSFPKQDLVALPDLSERIVDNWGLISCSETSLLIDPKEAINHLHRVAKYIAHKLAHQWFSNVITMTYVTALWVNEGLATYFAARGIDFLYPEWNSFQVTKALQYIRVMDFDSLQSSYAMSEVPSEEMSQIFYTFSYMKGSYLLHMVNTFLGEETFKQGIRNYVNKYKFSNPEQDDFWSLFTNEAHRVGILKTSISVIRVMESWTLQTGYPIVIVDRDYSANTVTLSQKRFTTTRLTVTAKKSCWWVPLSMTSSSELNFDKTKPHVWLNCEKNKLTFPLSNNESWIIFNVQMTGLYRVLYNDHNMHGIIRTLSRPDEYNKIHTMNRVQLIDDAFAFAQVGDLNYWYPFRILRYLKHEHEYTPWLAALKRLDSIGQLLLRTPNKRLYDEYMQRLLSPVYDRMRDMTVGLKGFEEIKLKNLIVGSACQNKIQDCIDQALRLFRKWMKTADPDSNNILLTELRPTIYCYAIKYGGDEEWDFLWKRYQQSKVATEKSRIAPALGCTNKLLTMQKYLSWTIEDNAVVRQEDAVSAFDAVANNEFGFVVARNFLYDNFKKICKYLYPKSNLLSLYIGSIGSQMKTEKELIGMQSFIKNSTVYILKETKIAADQTIEKIKINIRWKFKFADKMSSFLIDLLM